MSRSYFLTSRLVLVVGIMMLCGIVLSQTRIYAQAPEAQETRESSLITKNMPQNAVAMHGTPKYGGSDFTHFDYVAPNAPKGGTIRRHVIGSFDSLNPYIIKGVPAAGLTFLGEDLLTQALMMQSTDEPFSQYGLLAQKIDITADKSAVTYDLHPQARWHDGMAITADDVVWTYHALIEYGSPFFKAYYANVVGVDKLGPKRVMFKFSKVNDEINAELPLIMGQLPVLPKHYWTGLDENGQKRDFTQGTLTPPLGSGPYKITDVKPGKSITFERVKDWWAADLPVNKGRYNFDKIIYDYYRDDNVALEAFFAGEYDIREENIAKLWETSYNIPQVTTGQIIKETIANQRPSGMQSFAFNIRRPQFENMSVRRAIGLAYDFEWSNKQFAYGAYIRTNSFFENSDLAARDGAPTGRVRDILNDYKDDLSSIMAADAIDMIYNGRYTAPKTDGSGNLRGNLRKASRLLTKAGYVLNKDNLRLHEKTGQALEFEILATNPQFERWVLPFIKNLEKIGIKATFRVVDTAQFQNRIRDFDFDMTIANFPQSSSPGNEQRDFWGSDKADIPGSRNIIGIKNPVIDALIDRIIHAKDREDLVATTRAMDRILLAGHYVVPQYHYPYWRVAYRAEKLGRPDHLSPQSLGIIDTWWAK